MRMEICQGKFKSRLCCTTAALVLVCMPGTVMAQDNAAGAQQNADAADTGQAPVQQTNEIIVTAQFREQSLQDTPLAISALSGDSLRARSVDTVVQLAGTAPSIEIRSGGSAYGPAPQIYIRGIGQTETAYAYEPGVGLYVDDVYYGSALGSVLDLLDLDRVEILRGPQGTLAGRNSVGGAIRLFSKKPEGTGEGYVEVGTGARSRLDIRGSYDMPIIQDMVSLRVSGMARRQDGYLTRYDYACLNPGSGLPSAVSGPNCELGKEGGTQLAAGRASLRIQPNDRLDINITGTISRNESEPSATKLLDANFVSNVPDGFDQSNFVTGPKSRSNYATYTTLAFTDPPAYAGEPGYGYHEAVALEPVSRSNGNVISGNIEYDISDALSVTSITAYQHMNGNFTKDIDLSPIDLNTINYIFDHKQFTQEVRLNAELGDLVDLTVGGFYYDSDSKFSGIQLNRPGTARQNVFLLDDLIESRSKSAFVHAVVHVTDRLNITGGLRYTDDSKSYTFARRNPFAPDEPANASSGEIDGQTGVFADQRVDYRGVIDYRWTDNFMTYAQVSTGYRGGGVNPRPYVPEQAVSFGPESVISYEAGFKSDLIDRTLRVNGAVFVNDYTDIIFRNNAPTPNSTLNSTPVNAGDGTYKGAELEVDYSPFGGFALQGSVNYLDFKLNNVSADGADIVPPDLDAEAPNAPRWQGNLGVQYAFDTEVGTITPRLDVSYRAKAYADLDNLPEEVTKARTLTNARLGWASAEGDWEAALAVTNLFNKFYYFSKVGYPVGALVGDLAPPREWRLTLRRNF